MAETTVKETTEKTNSNKGNSKKGLIIGAIIGAIVLIVAAILVFVVIKPFSRVSLVGKYDLTSMETNGEDQSSMIALMKAFGMSATIEIENDKEGKISMFGDEAKFTYDKDTFRFESTDDEDEGSLGGSEGKYEFKDGTLTLIHTAEEDGETSTEKLTFTKQKDNN